MTPPILSILTPAVPSRMLLAWQLVSDLTAQIGGQPVEHLLFVDNRRRSVGAKRDALLRAARGQYVAFVDDDDTVSPHYVARLLEAAATKPDVITFRQEASVNGVVGCVHFRLGQPNEPFRPAPAITGRNAWHTCAWRRSLAVQSRFPDISYGEDWAWAAPLCALPDLREVHIPAILHHYRHSSDTTLAPPQAHSPRPPLTDPLSKAPAPCQCHFLKS